MVFTISLLGEVPPHVAAQTLVREPADLFGLADSEAYTVEEGREVVGHGKEALQMPLWGLR